jgi:hypothetical protein
MRAYSVEKVVSENGTVHLEAVPFPPGSLVEIIVLARSSTTDAVPMEGLKGSVLVYERPFDPVAEGDWDALQ